MKRLLLAMLAVAGYWPAQGQAALDSVLIRENRLQLPVGRYGRNLRILDRKDIDRLPVKSVNELLAYAAGVDVRQRGPWGAQADISIDGSTFDQVLVLIDGIRISDPQTGHNMMNIPVPLAAIERIEVLRGPAARTYGINALAGAINIVTRLPAHNTLQAQAYAGSSLKQDTATGSTYYSWGAQASGTIAGKRTSHGFSVAHDEGNGYRYNTGFSRYQLFYQNAIRTGARSTLKAMGGYTANTYGASFYYAAPNDLEATEKVQTALGSLSWEYRPSERLSITPGVSYRYSKDDYRYTRLKPELYHNVHETNVPGVTLNATYKTAKGMAGAGAEWRQEDIASNSLGRRSRSNLGFYAEYRHFFGDALTASAGAYVNRSSLYGTQVLPSADVSYRFRHRWKAFANAGAGQRLPTYTDLYYKGPANIGNDALQPERAWYAEAGLQYRQGALAIQGSYAYRWITDFIDWVRTADTDPWQPQNYQSVRTQVLSLRTDVVLGSLLDLPETYRLDLSLTYTYLEPAIAAATSDKSTKYVTDALRHQAVLQLQALLWQRLQAGIGIRYQQRLNANDYTLADVRLGYRSGRLLYYADINNLLDVAYKEAGAVPLPGRWMTLGIRAAIL